MWKYQRKKPKSTRSKKIDKLDRIFSKYIRRRDCGYAYGHCISCGRIIYYDKCDAGHYINRRHMAVRYDELNVHAQCISCNRFMEGNIQGYRQGLISKIGEKQLAVLEMKMHNSCKMSEAELDILFDYYKKQLHLLEKNQKFLH